MEASGQRLNAKKSKIFFINTKEEVEREIYRIMEFKKEHFHAITQVFNFKKALKFESKVCNTILEKLDKK